MSKTQNVDPNEIRKFEELASRWWDRTVNLSHCTISTHCAPLD